MNLNFSYILTIKKIHNLSFEDEDMKAFLEYQIYNLPDFIKFFFLLVSSIFNNIFIFIFFKSFRNLSEKKRISIFMFIKKYKLFPFSLLIRFYESMVILRSFENPK